MTTETLTAATITDAQIVALRDEAATHGDDRMVDLCGEALRPCADDDVSSWKVDARSACAKAINAAAAMNDE